MKKVAVTAMMLGIVLLVLGSCRPSEAVQPMPQPDQPPAPMPPQPMPPQPQPPAPLPPLSIQGKTTYEPHQLVRLQAVGVSPKAALLWRVYPSSNVHRAAAPRGWMLLEFAAPPGTYEVELLVISQSDVGMQVEEARTTVIIKSCHPPEPPKPEPPKPDPKPEPPRPDPKGGKLDPPNAIGRIQFGNAGCSATVIGPRRPDGRWDVLTAAHCNNGVGQRGTMVMPSNQKRYTVVVVAHDRTCDVCWMRTEESIDDIEYAMLAEANPQPNVKVWHQGYGYDKPRNREDGYVKNPENSQGQTQFWLSVSSGDSGGGIFRADNDRLVSTCCCTAGMARPADMWGGSLERIVRLRPKSTDARDVWAPAPMPAPSVGVHENHWIPIAMPVVSVVEFTPGR